jgi:cyclic pyranopterin phosphate synthase
MTDSYNRTINYLRLSITGRCNLRCLYCMPPQGIPWTPHDNILSFEEILRIVRVLAKLGIRAVKVTGGEPLVRRGAAGLIASLKKIEGISQVTITSNGILVDQYLENLVEAGIDGLNLSIDTLNPETFRRLTGSEDFERLRSCLDRVLGPEEPGAGAKPEAPRPGVLPFPVKINNVPIRGLNEGDITGLAALAKNRDIAVRFIELMPLGRAAAFRPVPEAELVSLLEGAWGPLVPLGEKLGNGPAVYYRPQGFRGKIGFISAVSRGFCETCNRLRLSSTGRLIPCLSSDKSLDLRGLLRGDGNNPGCTEEKLEQAILALAAQKPRAHTFSGIYGPEQEHPAGMFGIGG